MIHECFTAVGIYSYGGGLDLLARPESKYRHVNRK